MHNYDFDLIVSNLLDLSEQVEDERLRKQLKKNIIKLINLADDEISQTHLDHFFELYGHIEKVEKEHVLLSLDIKDYNIPQEELRDWLLLLE